MSDKVNIEVQNNKIQDINVDFFPFLSKDQSSQTYTFTFQPNSAEYNAQTVEAAGKIAGIGGPSGTKVFKAISTSPFQQQVGIGDSVDEGDILTAELDATPSAKETVEVVVSFSDISETKTLPEDLGGNAQYLYIVNHDDATVSCVDTVQGAEIATIPMPSDYNTGDVNVKCVYRFYDKEVFVFYNGNRLPYILIDADPSSPNFNSIKSGPNNAGVGGVRGERVAYVQTKDYFVTVQNYSVFDKNQVFLSNFSFANWGNNSANNSFLLGSYVFGGNNNSQRQVVDATKTGYTFIQDYGNSKSGAGRYNPINGLIYWVERGAVRVVEVETWTVIASLSAGTDRGSCDIDLDNNIVLAVDTANFNRNVTKIDADTNTVIGSENPGEAMDQIFWSRASGLFYTRKRGTDQLFVYDATKSPGSMKVNQITVGKTPVTNFQNNPCACINQIML